MKRNALKYALVLLLTISALLSLSSCGAAKAEIPTVTLPAVTVTVSAPPVTVTSTVTVTATGLATGPITISGYLTTSDDVHAGLGADTAAMVHMRMMAASGLGITWQNPDGKWGFYFFSGTISSGMPATGWVFNGTGAQLDAWNIVTAAAATAPKNPVPITVKGMLKGDTTTNPGMDADGIYYQIITVTSITPN